MRIASIAMALASLACAGTAIAAKKDRQEAPAPGAGSSAEPENPFPSTYKPYPGVPTVIRGATIYDGEGGRIDNGVVFLSGGKVTAIGGPDTPIPADVAVIDAKGKWVTPGVIDIHSHLGDYPSPSVAALSDGNEATSPVTAHVWAEHSVWPQDPGFGRAMANGGVTTLQILPGSANLFGGRGVTLKNVPARTMQGMKFRGAPYSLKMACGENPKRVYGSKGREPSTRMGNMAVDRQTWIKAREYQKKRAAGKDQTRDLGMETLADVLEGKILVQNHCYRADEMANVIDMAKEFGYKVTAFHHAVESYKIADLLRDNGICSAMWGDWYGFKMEAYDGIKENIPLVHNAGACAIVHSDDENGIQRLNQEAAKALGAGRRMGIDVPDEIAWTWLAINPAKAMGIADKTGSLKPGKMGDVVLWNGDPFSTYTRPEKVWVDGALLYDAMDPKRRSVSDFELGQIGAGDVK
ncbi:imidazolonepropionase-like amidohydrolase [Sphingobium fontiphilum]|uniref:Imidazolonepropionase-like amidohydrolase n=2 Tax=Sphingobium fontiphilum TaxID=944425 RepID=A0A7W6DP41_9SPHN|nr:amidohydrolase [Sphingobium fontiphilum]MBB3983458.1 imidazolonepropionase-like amidohydrolase [Sphingobium fontiphilum]